MSPVCVRKLPSDGERTSRSGDDGIRVAKNSGPGSLHLPCDDLYGSMLGLHERCIWTDQTRWLKSLKYADLKHRVCSVQTQQSCKPGTPPCRSLQGRCDEPESEFFATRIPSSPPGSHRAALRRIASVIVLAPTSGSVWELFFIRTDVVRKSEPQTKSRLWLRVTSNS